MKTRLISLLIPVWLGCGGVVDLGPVEGEDTVTDTEFEPAFVGFAPWGEGMCGLFSDELVRCWRFEDRASRIVPGLAGIALGGTDMDACPPHGPPHPSRVCAVQRSGSVACVDDDCCESRDDCRPSGDPYRVAGLEMAVALAVDEVGVTALRSDGKLQLVRDCRWVGYPDPVPYPNCGEQATYEVDVPIVAFDSWGSAVTASGHAYASTIKYEEAVIEQYRIVPRDDLGATFPPLRLPGVEDAVAIEVARLGSNFLLRRSGKITAWGHTRLLGIGKMADVPGTGDVEGIDDAIFIESNGVGTCAIRSDRSLWCWGNSNSNNLGFPDPHDEYGTYSGSYPAPLPVPGMDNVRAVAMGNAFTCAVRGTNEVWCWGWQGWRNKDNPTHTPYRVHMR